MYLWLRHRYVRDETAGDAHRTSPSVVAPVQRGLPLRCSRGLRAAAVPRHDLHPPIQLHRLPGYRVGAIALGNLGG